MAASQWGALAGLMSALCQIGGYALYLRAIGRLAIRPNGTSWALWAFGTFISLAVYQGITADWSKLMLLAACAICSVAVILVAAWRKSFWPPDRWDYMAAGADLLVVAIWLTAENPQCAYGALLLDTLITFIPILRSIAADPKTEAPLPWLVWTFAYLAMLMAAALRWESWTLLMLPALYLVAHGSIYVMVLYSALIQRGGRAGTRNVV